MTFNTIQLLRRTLRRATSTAELPARPARTQPNLTEMNAIRAAIAAGRTKAAVRMLRKVRLNWRVSPESLRWVSEDIPLERVLGVTALLSSRGNYGFAAAILAEANYQEAAVGIRRSIAQTLVYGGQHELAASLFRDLSSGHPLTEEYTEEMRIRDSQRLGLSELYFRSNHHIRDVRGPTETDLRGFLLIYNVSNPVLTGLMVPLVRPLVQQGYSLAAVTIGTLRTPKSGIPEFDKLQGSVGPGGKAFVGRPRRELSQDWRIDWAAGIAEAGGINYFPYFQERLSQKARRYRADILSDPHSAKRFAALQQQADVALEICEYLLALAAHNKPIRIALMDSHFAPQGIIREWCNQVGRLHGIHAVALSVGYENYFSNLASLEATTLAVEDLTAQPNLRQPFLGGPHRLEASLAEAPHLDRDPDDQLMAWICQNRSKVGMSSRPRADVLRKAHAIRATGGQVFVALGKVSIDFAAPGDRGFAHPDFISWINHLIEAVSGTGNLLLIKPHPHELREEIVVEGVELLRELVVPELPDNVLFLEHDSFNTHDLAEFVDVAFLWNGTAALEFSVLGVPVVAASIWADRDYPVGLQILRSREEYAEVLYGERLLMLAEGVERRAAMFLRLMRSDHVAMPYKYLRRAATNLTVGPPQLDLDRLSALEETPDLFVQRASSRFFEFS